MTNARFMTISVLICTANRPRLLERALQALASGTDVPDEVVVVNGGEEGANRVVECFATSFPRVILLQYPNVNLSVSRNLGLSHCSGDVVATTDDDAIVAPNWVARLRQVFAEAGDLSVVGGPVEGMSDRSFLSRLADLVVFPSFPDRRPVRTIPGVNAAYRRDVIDAVGQYDATLFRGEDVDYNWRAIRLGFQPMYDPSIVVRHEHRTTFKGLLQQQYMYGRAYVLVRRKWPDMYAVYPRGLHSLRDVAKLAHCVLAVLYQPALAARRLPRASDGILAYPLLLAHHAVWKLGMLWQSALPGNQPGGAPTVTQQACASVVHRWTGGAAEPQSVSERVRGSGAGTGEAN